MQNLTFDSDGTTLSVKKSLIDLNTVLVTKGQNTSIMDGHREEKRRL